MTNQPKDKFEPGDRVRIVGGPWASDCGVVVKVIEGVVRVRADSRGYVVFVRPQDLERIE